MRTLVEIISLIEEARANRLEARKSFEKSAESRYKKRVEWLNSVKLYLEAGPDAGAIITDRNRVKNLIASLEKRKPVPIKAGDEYNPEYKQAVKKYESMYQLPKLRDQLKTLNFILNG